MPTKNDPERMPAKIGFTVASSTGEDERYRATELNYHGPTVRGWRSALDCGYPQEIVLQLNVAAVLHRIQILSHQYLIPQKIEIWIAEGFDCDGSLSPTATDSFEYLGFITLSDNRSTGYKSRELKSIAVPPTIARYIKLRLHANHPNEKNVYNQIGLIAVNVLGDEVPESDPDGEEVNNNGTFCSGHRSESTLISNPSYVSPYDDLAFEMYVDRDVARIMRAMEAKKHQAVLEERFEYASKLKLALKDLREAGETLGKYEQEKRQAINTEDYDKAKMKKLQIDEYREQVYRVLRIDRLLELDGPVDENDLNCDDERTTRAVRREEPAPPTETSGKPLRGTTPSPGIGERDRAEWGRAPHGDPFEYAPTPSQLIHSQSQTSFDRVARHWEESPSFPLSDRVLSDSQPVGSFATYQQQVPAQRFRARVSAYNSHAWPHMNDADEEPPGTYHSMPTHQARSEETAQAAKYGAAEFPVAQRASSPEEVHLEREESSAVPSMSASFEQETVRREAGSRPKSPTESNASLSKSPPPNAVHRPSTLRGSLRRRNKSTGAIAAKSSYEAYEERMLPALRHYHANEIVRECQLGLVEPTKKSKLNEREKKQAALPITVFGIELVEKFYSKHFADKEEGLKQLQEHLRNRVSSGDAVGEEAPRHPPNKIARAAIFLLHRALRDKVYSVYSSAADAIRLFFSEYVPKRVSSAEVARSVERLLPELIAKSGDATPRIHNKAAHTLLSMADCKEVRELHIIPVQLSRPLTSSVHPRLALSRLEMIEQLILNQGISTEKQSGLTCRTLAEFGSSGLHHPAEAVRKVSERILIQVYRVNPRLVRKQLPPDDDITRRNLLYRQLFQEFDFMDLQRKRELAEKSNRIPSVAHSNSAQSSWEGKQPDAESTRTGTASKDGILPSQLPKRTVNQQTSPMKPYSSAGLFPGGRENPPFRSETQIAKDLSGPNGKTRAPSKDTGTSVTAHDGEPSRTSCPLEKRKGMVRIAEEKADEKEPQPEDVTLKFPNLVDSVRVTEERMSFTQKSLRNVKSLKYIFPTSYIGNSTTSQAAVNSSNSVDTFCKMPKKTEWCAGRAQVATPHSGIPVPTNGRLGAGLPLPPVSGPKRTGKAKPLDAAAESDATNGGTEADAAATSAAGRGGSLGPGVGEKEPNVEEGEGDDGKRSQGTGAAAGGGGSRGKPRESNETFEMCIFCFASDKWFTEESLNQHYWMSCPMLTRCSHCNEVVEVSGLIQHRLEDCELKRLFVKCEICQEAIEKERVAGHECVGSQAKDAKLRCTLCHTDLAEEDDWREHLMGESLCPRHPRRSDENADGRKQMGGTGE